MNELLKSIADNPALLNALKEVIEKRFKPEYFKGNSFYEVSDEQLGQIMRASLWGLKRIEEAFAEIEKNKSTPEIPEKINRAR